MNLYLAMWVRGPDGNNVTKKQMDINKIRAINVAERLQKTIGHYYGLVVPHTDPILSDIDSQWLKTKDASSVQMAMDRCYKLLSDCDGILLFTYGHLSEGMKKEKEYAEQKGLFIYEADELTDATLEELCLELLDFECIETS